MISFENLDTPEMNARMALERVLKNHDYRIASYAQSLQRSRSRRNEYAAVLAALRASREYVLAQIDALDAEGDGGC